MGLLIDQHRMLICSTAQGSVMAHEICIYFDRLADTLSLPEDFDILCNLSMIDRFDMDYNSISEAVRVSAKSRCPHHFRRIAFIADRQIEFGIANMYASLGRLHGENVEVFRSENAASDWLVD